MRRRVPKSEARERALPALRMVQLEGLAAVDSISSQAVSSSALPWREPSSSSRTWF